MSQRHPLGYWASIQASYHALFGGAGMLALSARVHGPLGRVLLSRACRRLQQRHPLLRSRLLREQKRWWAEVRPGGEAGPLPLRWTTLPRSGWAGLVEEELACPLDHTEAPLWRVVVAPAADDTGAHELALTVHHALADALCGVALIAELLETCAALHRGEAASAVEELHVHRPVEQLPLRLPPSRRARDVDAAGEPSWSGDPDPASSPPAPRYEQGAPVGHRRCRVIPLPLPRAPAGLRSACRRRGTTVQGALMAATLRAAAAAFDLPRGPTLSLDSAVDLRRLASPPIEANRMGCFITMLSTEHAVVPRDGGPRPDGPDDAFWASARACSALLRRRLSRRLERGIAPRRFDAPVLEALIGARLTRAEEVGSFAGGPALSNLGRVTLPDTAPFRCGALRFTTAQRSGLYPLFLSFLSLSGGGLSGCLSWPEPLLATASVEEVAARLAEQLVGAAGR